MATKKNAAQEKKSHKKLYVILGIFLGLYIVSLFTPIISNYTQFPLYVIKCGGRPIVGIWWTYITPDSPSYGVSGLNKAFFCSEEEAQAAGFQKSPTN
jgi:hypothetical protein